MTVLLPLTLYPVSFPVMKDNDRFIFTINTKGLFTYGFHSNTFHLRQFWFYNSLKLDRLDFFIALSGYKDTHVPESNYNFILDNLMLNDYGVEFRLADWIDLSMRGAAVYQPDDTTFLLTPSWYETNNPTAFDMPASYQGFHQQAAGIRLQLHFHGFTLGYSQGDYRHQIPIAARLSYSNSMDNMKYRFSGILYLENRDPLVYLPENWTWNTYISLDGNIKYTPEWASAGRIQFTYRNLSGYMSILAEQAMIYNPLSLTLAMREIFTLSGTEPILLEAALCWKFHDMASLGLQAGTDGRVMIGSRIDF